MGNLIPPLGYRSRYPAQYAMTNDLIANSRFASLTRSTTEGVTPQTLRKIAFQYATQYQEVYWFNQLEDAFAFLELCELDPTAMPDELPAIRDGVQIAMGEYFESPNEVSTAVNRLLDVTPFTPDDLLTCINHVWRAHACNESTSVFVDREDAILCKLYKDLALNGR